MEEKTFTVTGIDTHTFDNGGKAITIAAGKEKFKFYDKKKDGNNTKAYEGYLELRPLVGDTLTAFVEEKTREYTKRDGSTGTATDYRIAYFKTGGEVMEKIQKPAPKQEMPTQSKWKQPGELNNGIIPKESVDAINAELAGIKSEDMPF